MASDVKENYIKALFYLHQKNEDISLSDLGEELQVSKPTANDMIKKLQSEGIVISKKYKPIRITEKGKQRAAEIIRKHRLSEMFLLQIMKFGWEEVHEIAEELEHIKTDKFFDRMDELMGFPIIDPHGSPIPDKNGNFNKPSLACLYQEK
jgi:DtxR family Mn-dependent transcriptional regulator